MSALPRSGNGGECAGYLPDGCPWPSDADYLEWKYPGSFDDEREEERDEEAWKDFYQDRELDNRREEGL